MATRWTSKHTGQKIDDTIDYVCNPNLLDNWYFGNPVNQRGQTEYVVSEESSAYTIDRWQMFYYAGSVSLENDGITISANAGTNAAFIQKHENGLSGQYANFAYRGMKATLSALASDGTLGSKTFTFPETYQGNTTVVSFNILSEISIQIYFHNTAGVMTRIYVNKGKSVTLKGIKLELGSQQTLAHQDADGNWVLNEIPDYGEQLARCQRYQIAISNSYSIFIRADCVLTNAIYFTIPLPTAMRVVPTIFDKSTLKIMNPAGGSLIDGFNFSCLMSSTGMFSYLRITATKSSHGLTDATLDLGSTIFDANL